MDSHNQGSGARGSRAGWLAAYGEPVLGDTEGGIGKRPRSTHPGEAG